MDLYSCGLSPISTKASILSCRRHAAALGRGPLVLTILGFLVLSSEVLLSITIFSAVLFTLWPPHFVLNFISDNEEWKSEMKIRSADRFFAFVIVSFFGLIFPNMKVLWVENFVDCGFLLALVAPGLLFYVSLELYARSFPRLMRSILITLPSSGRNRGNVGDKDNAVMTYLCFIMVFYSTVLCVVWYAYRYDPEGTVNRVWTGVFG